MVPVTFFLPRGAAVLCASAAAEPADKGDRDGLVRRLDAGLEKAARYLVSKQSADGAWRSETYGACATALRSRPW